jgi:hypothetical protein
MAINLKELAKFLVEAKIQTYAGDGKEIPPQRPEFRELEFTEGDWGYRDSYAGFYSAPGQEIVRFKGKPVWTMAYSGGMIKEYHGDLDFAIKTFSFLKKALKKVDESNPYRGPKLFQEEDWEYTNSIEGDITNFKGTEKIFYKEKEVFKQDYIGGLIISKN